MYTDTPAPSPLYSAFMGFFILLFSAIPAWVIITGKAQSHEYIFILITFLFPFLIMVMILHAAHHTSYTINGNVLEMQSGIVIKSRLDIAQITEIKETGYIPRVLGFGFNDKGICNRFSKGLLIKTKKEKIYISPRDVKIFKYELEWRMKK